MPMTSRLIEGEYKLIRKYGNAGHHIGTYHITTERGTQSVQLQLNVTLTALLGFDCHDWEALTKEIERKANQ